MATVAQWIGGGAIVLFFGGFLFFGVKKMLRPNHEAQRKEKRYG